MSGEILVATLVTLIVEETTGLSRWSAVKLARWAAKHIYRADVERAQKRAEEWDALITKSIPTNIVALCFGLSLGAAAVVCVAARRVTVILLSLGWSLPDARLVERNELRAAERRQASLDLLRAARELQLLVAETAQFNSNHQRTHLAQIRRQTVSTQLKAANVALLNPDVLARSAERLAEAAGSLYDAVERKSSDAGLTPSVPALAELDESVKAFLRDAVAASRAPASPGAVPVVNTDQGANDDS